MPLAEWLLPATSETLWAERWGGIAGQGGEGHIAEGKGEAWTGPAKGQAAAAEAVATSQGVGM